jgi:hypothetical protein
MIYSLRASESSFGFLGIFLYNVVNGIFSSFRLDLSRWTAQATFAASLTVVRVWWDASRQGLRLFGVSSFAVAAYNLGRQRDWLH